MPRSSRPILALVTALFVAATPIVAQAAIGRAAKVASGGADTAVATRGKSFNRLSARRIARANRNTADDTRAAKLRVQRIALHKKVARLSKTKSSSPTVIKYFGNTALVVAGVLGFCQQIWPMIISGVSILGVGALLGYGLDRLLEVRQGLAQTRLDHVSREYNAVRARR